MSEWQAAGLELPDLTHIRRYRLGQVRQYLRKFDYAGIVLFDPLNVYHPSSRAKPRQFLAPRLNRGRGVGGG